MDIYKYRAFGLTTRSNFELFSIPRTEVPDVCDLMITKLARLSNMPDELADSPILTKTTEGVQYHVNNIATFLIREDNQIIIQQYADQDALVECILMKGVMSAYFTSKGYTVFNGAAVLIQSEVHLLLGGPGIGISAVAATFHKLGHSVLSDEVIVLKMDDNGLSLIPSLTYTKLWEDMIKQLGLGNNTKTKVRQELSKFYTDLAPIHVQNSYPISKTLFFEIKSTGKLRNECARLNTFELIEMLGEHVFKGAANSSNNKLARFKTLTALAAGYSGYRITRPRAIWHVEKFVDFIISNTHE